MLAAQICREMHFGGLAAHMQSRVPRCLFGRSNPKETMELLQDVLGAERVRFQCRWGIDPFVEDKENTVVMRPSPAASAQLSPSKRRGCPYAKQTSIHDFWRSRKVCDPSKKPSSNVVDGTLKQQQHPQQQLQQQSQAQPQLQPQPQPLAQSQTQIQAQPQTQASQPNIIGKMQPLSD